MAKRFGRNRRVSAVLAVMWGLLSCAVVTPGPAAAREEIVITTGEFAPYVGAKLPGFGPHAIAIQRVFARAGIVAKVEVLPWQRAYSEVANGTKVATFPWLKTEERAADLLYPDLVLENFNDVMFYRADRFPNGLTIKTLEELAQSKLRVVGVASYWYVDKLRALGANQDIVFSPEQAYARLANNLADIHINVDRVGRMEMRQYLGRDVAAQFTAAPQPLQVAASYLAFSRKHPRAAEMMAIWLKFGKTLLPLTN